MKYYKIYIIIIELFFVNIAFSQNWIGLPNSTPLDKVTSFKFLNAQTGFIGGIIGSSKAAIYKTTDAGLTWGNEYYWDEDVSSFGNMDFDFIDVGNGNLIFFIGYDDKLVKYVFGNPDDILLDRPDDYPNVYHKVKVTGNGTIYWLFTGNAGYNPNFGTRYMYSLYKSTNLGQNWTEPIYNAFQNVEDAKALVMTDISYSESNPNLVAICGYWHKHLEDKTRFIYRYSTDNFNQINVGGDGNILSGSLYESFDHAQYLDNGRILFLGPIGLHEFVPGTSNFPERIFNFNGQNPTFVREGGIVFRDNSTGYVVLRDGRILRTTNGGSSWSTDEDGISQQSSNHPPGMLSIGDVVYYQEWAGSKLLYSRQISTNFSLERDNLTPGTGTFYSYGSSFSVPGSGGLRGGAAIVSTDRYNNGDVFYKWNNNSLNYSGYPFKIESIGTTIKANYKSKKYSNSSSSISNTTQRRAVRDKFGNVNAIHESMGGIFFSKSTDNGTTFSNEEVVNDNPNSNNSFANDNNINSFTSELKQLAFHYTGENMISTEKTSLVCWERRDGNNINVNIAQRMKDKDAPESYYWEMDPIASFQITGVTESEL